MHLNSTGSSFYQILHIKVYPDLNVIEVQGDTHRVEPKVMMLLNYLSQHQGEVCSKQSLIEAIWPNQLIADEALTRLIFVLRNVLGDDAKAPKFISTVPKKGYVLLQPVSLPQERNRKKWMLAAIASALVLFLSFWIAQYQPTTSYKIIKSAPVTFQEGREYGFVQEKLLSAYFHQHQNVTKLMVAENAGAFREIANDEWEKRSLNLFKSSFFYIRFNDSESQIIRQRLSEKPEVLFTSTKPIFHLSLNNDKGLLFSQYIDNANIELQQFSFIDGQVTPVKFSVSSVPMIIKQHFYDEFADRLVFVGVQSRLPIIYGYRYGESNYQFEINGFDSINSISAGKDDHTLLVTGSYQQNRGVWLVNTTTSEMTLLLNANDDEVTGAYMNSSGHSIFYTLESHRQDLIATDWDGREVALPKLNSTLKEGNAKYSAESGSIYFSSDRSGDSELYEYKIDSQKIEPVTRLRASKIWYYSFSKDRKKLAIVFSTEQIQLGIVDIETGELLHSVVLDEIKFPLGWSSDNQSIYVSEHRSNIAMYLYDANTLAVRQKQPHLGLSAVEVGENEIIGFDYTRSQFVHYSFNDNTAKPISQVLANTAYLAPTRVSIDKKQAYILESNNNKKQLIRVQFSEVDSDWHISRLSSFTQDADIQVLNPQRQEFLFLKDYNSQNGSIIELKLQH